jgi:serine/threonine protein kinase
MVVKVADLGEAYLGFLANDFDILEKLGSGGMGQVFKAYQKSMDRFVAIKVLNADLCNNQLFVERFKREARIAGKFSHPNAIQVFDIGNYQNQYYFIMEYISGNTLKEKLREEGRFEQKYVFEILKQILSVLKEAERLNIIHRDIKPDNIMFTATGAVKLADLGLAREIDDDSGLTQQKIALGTPHYMAPEQAQGLPVDIRADQYSLGITAFHMLTGRAPFVGKTTMEILVHHVKTPMITPSSLVKDISPEIDKFILKMTQKSPSLRFQTVEEIILALDKIGTISKIVKTTKRKRVTKSKSEINLKIEKNLEKSSFGGLFILIGLIILIVGGGAFFAFFDNTKIEGSSVEKSLQISNKLFEEKRYEESLESLKSAVKQTPASEQYELIKKLNEIEKLISSSAIEKIMISALDSSDKCKLGISELEMVSNKYPSQVDVVKSKIKILQTRIHTIHAEEKRLLELSIKVAKEEAINQLSLDVNTFLSSDQHQQAMSATLLFKEKYPEANEKINSLSENIIRHELDHSNKVFEKIKTYTKNKEFDQCTAYLNSIKENCYQNELKNNIDEQIKKNIKLKKEYELEIVKKVRQEFALAKSDVFGLLKLGEIKAARAKLETIKAKGLSTDAIDFFAKIIGDYDKIYNRIIVKLADDHKNKFPVERIGNRNISCFINSAKDGVIQYSFMDSKLELTPLSEEWAQTYTMVANKLARLNKGCRLIRISHFAYANGDLEGAYFLMKEAESLGLEKDEQGKFSKNIIEDFLNNLDIQLDKILAKANTLIAEKNKTKANQLVNNFIKKYKDTAIYTERKDEIEMVLALSNE